MSDRVLTPSGPHGRKCRVCTRQKLIGPKEAGKVYPSYPWGDTDLCEQATLICPWCKAAYFKHGKRLKSKDTAYWIRTVSVKERAYQLTQAYNSKDRQECREKITAGGAKAADPGDVQ